MTKASRTLPLILFISILAPLANDMFIPSLPAMAKEFATTNTQLILTVYMFGIGLSQLIIGPLLDRFGRKIILLVCLAIFILGSIGIIFAANIDLLLIARLVQSVGAACFIPGSMAIAKDIYPKEKISHVIPIIMGAVVVAPIVAPLLGSYIQIYFNWRANFFIYIALALIVMFIVSLFFSESLKEKNHHAIHIKHLLANYKMLLSNKCFLGYTLSAAGGYGVIFGYVAVSPFLLIHNLHVPVAHFGYYFGAFAAMLATISFLIPVLSKRFTMGQLTLIGSTSTLLGAILFLACNLFNHSILSVFLPMIVVSFGLGFLRPSAVTAAMHIFPPQNAGIAGAMVNCISFLFGTLSTGLVAKLSDSAVNFGIIMLCFGLFAFVFTLFAAFKVKSAASHE